jgi:hypothetical protein
MRSRPDVGSGVSDSTSLIGEFPKKEEAGPYCLARIFVLSSRLVSSREKDCSDVDVGVVFSISLSLSL